MATPQVEKEYKTLTRDYENSWAKYRDLKAKQMEAELAQTLESERKGERFALIEPPLMPEKPFKPNRLAMFFIGIVLSVGAALGLVVLLETLDNRIRGSRGVRNVIDMDPLVAIPYIVTPMEQRQQTLKLVMIGVAVIAGGMMITAAVHWLFMPLDVLWYAGLRKLDL
jgi:hypothetical protein